MREPGRGISITSSWRTCITTEGDDQESGTRRPRANVFEVTRSYSRRRGSGTIDTWRLAAIACFVGFAALAPSGTTVVAAESTVQALVGNLTVRSTGYSLNSTAALENPFDDTTYNSASSIAVLPDGTGVYVGGERGGLAYLSRAQGDGSLTLENTWMDSDFDEALKSVEQILISPDGTKLVTIGAGGSSAGTFGLFSITSDGDLHLLQEDDHRGIIRAGFSPTSSRDLYAIGDDRNVLTHYTYDHGRFDVSQTMGGFSCVYGLGIAPDGRNVYVADDCLYVVTNFKRDPDTGSLVFKDELKGSATNGDGLGCIKSLSFASSGEWAVGLDACDDALSVLARDPDTGTLAPRSTIVPTNPSGNRINMDKTWNSLVVSDGSGDIYVADWADRNILWVSAAFDTGGDGSVSGIAWFPVDFRPSALAISPELDNIYAASKENTVWRGGVLSRVASRAGVPTPDPETPPEESPVNVVLAIALSLSLLVVAAVVAEVAIKYISRKRNIDKYSLEEETLRETLEANPNDAVAHNNLGFIMETVYKDFKEAEVHYNEALRINPRAAFAHNSLGHLLYHRHKNFEAAEEHYRRAISLHWGSPEAHYNLGCLLQHNKDDLVEAEQQYRHAIKCDPKHGMAQYNLGWVLEKVKNDLPGAEKCYRAAIEADPEDKDAGRRLAKVIDQIEAEAMDIEQKEKRGKQEAKRSPVLP